MVPTNFPGHRPYDSGEEDFFTTCGYGGHLSDVAPNQ